MINGINVALNELRQKSESERLAKFQKNWAQYYGKADKPLKVSSDKPDDNVRLNFARMIVDKGVSFLFGKDLRFEITEGKETPAEIWLDGCWRTNRKMTTLQKVALNGAVCGEAFVRIHTEPGQKYPRVIVVDPETVTVTLAADDVETVIGYKIQYPSVDPVTERPIAVRQLIERNGSVWHVVDQRGDEGGAFWTTLNDAVWPYEFPPILYCQNLPCPNEFWGFSDLEDDLIEVMSANNFIMSNLVKIIRYHGHPKTWGSGFNEDRLDVAVDKTILLPKDGQLHNLEMTSDLDKLLNVYKELKLFTHELSRVPEVSTGKVESVGQLSGVALEILYQPLLEKTETKRLTYGDMIVELNRRLLAVGGFGDSSYTELRWQELLPKDVMLAANAALAMKQLGISTDTLVQKFGYDPDVEREKRAKETDLGQALLDAFDRGGTEPE